MDSITHIVLGAAMGEGILGKKIGKKAMLWGALAATIPDFDVLGNPFMDTIDGLFFHRGITHSIFFCTLLFILLGLIANRVYKKQNTTYKEWTLLFALGLFSHIFLDSLTAYGTGLLEPFSDGRFTFNVLFIADPFYTVPLLISSIALLILNKNSQKRLAWNKIGLVISSVYLLFTLANKGYMNMVFEKALKNNQIHYSRFYTQPTPLNNILWCAFAEDETGYHIGYFSLFDKDKNIDFYFIPRNEHLLAELSGTEEIESLKKFTNNYYVITQKDSIRYLNAIQFGQFGGWYDRNAPFAFSFGIEKGKDNNFSLQRGRWESSGKEAFSTLINRIKGK